MRNAECGVKGDEREHRTSNIQHSTSNFGAVKSLGCELRAEMRLQRELLTGLARGQEKLLADIHKEIAAVRTDFRDMKTVKERLAKMQGEKLFAFTNKIDAPSFRILCAVLANGDVAKASRALNLSDSTVRSRIAKWDAQGPAYKVLGELVRWRKEMGRKEIVSLPESILKNTAPSADFAGVLSDVLDEVLAMNDSNWSEKADTLAELLRPYVPR